MPCTAAWVTNRVPALSSSVIDHRQRDQHADLPGAGADQQQQQVGEEHPDRHADGDLGDPAEPLAVGRARGRPPRRWGRRTAWGGRARRGRGTTRPRRRPSTGRCARTCCAAGASRAPRRDPAAVPHPVEAGWRWLTPQTLAGQVEPARGPLHRRDHRLLVRPRSCSPGRPAPSRPWRSGCRPRPCPGRRRTACRGRPAPARR